MGCLPVEKTKMTLEREKSSGVISGGSAVGEPRVHPLDGASKHNPGEDPSREKRVRRSTPDLAPERTLIARSTKTSLIHEAEHRRRRHAFARGHTGHLSRQNAGETPRHKSLDSSFLNNIFLSWLTKTGCTISASRWLQGRESIVLPAPRAAAPSTTEAGESKVLSCYDASDSAYRRQIPQQISKYISLTKRLATATPQLEKTKLEGEIGRAGDRRLTTMSLLSQQLNVARLRIFCS